MALISTYWGLVRPLRHHFRTGIASRDRVKRAPTKSADPPNEERHAGIDRYTSHHPAGGRFNAILARRGATRLGEPEGTPFMETTGRSRGYTRGPT